MTDHQYSLPGSVVAVMTGDTGTGKSWQAASVVKSDEFGPGAFFKTEASSEGTADDLFSDESRCVLIDVPDLDLEVARAILLDLFPPGGLPATVDEARAHVHRHASAAAARSGKPPPPVPGRVRDGHRRLRSLAVDTASTLYRQQIETEARKAREFEATNPGAKYGQLASRNPRELGKRAQPPWVSFVATLAEIGRRHRGLVILVSVHHRPVYESTGSGENVVRRQVGVVPDVGYVPDKAVDLESVNLSANWDKLAALANIVWALFAKIPSLAGYDGSQVNAVYESGRQQKFCAVTTRFRNVPGLGHVLWPKRQVGASWANALDQVPPFWDPDHCKGCPLGDGPDLGAVLREAARAWAAQRAA